METNLELREHSKYEQSSFSLVTELRISSHLTPEVAPNKKKIILTGPLGGTI
jgi:hypothetical protein